jgi:hypothetical protein
MKLIANETFAAALAGLAGMGLWALLIAAVAAGHQLPVA